MLDKALPFIKGLLTVQDDLAHVEADVLQLSAKLAGLTERVAKLEGKMESLPQVVKATVDDRLMEASRRRKRRLPE